MKLLAVLFCLALSLSASAQPVEEVLATAAGKNFTTASLSAEARELYAQRSALVAKDRSAALDAMINTSVVDLEAKATSTTPELVLAPIRARAATPSVAEIQKIYDLNRENLGGRSLAETRSEIVEYLKNDLAEKLVSEYLKTLRIKYKVVMRRDVNATDLKPEDVLATVGPTAIVYRAFAERYNPELNDREFKVYDAIKSDLLGSMMTVMLADEAKERGVEPGAIIASEITDKMRDFTPGERYALESALQKRLFTKYNAKILLKRPMDYVQNISPDDDPATGPVNAPVTIVMFVDFQCPACSATHPIMQKVVSEFPGKVRFVVRDFPLTETHENAFRAAIAANAANVQGRFFEYAEILYKNQANLDEQSLKKYAAAAGLDPKQFELDLKNPKFEAEVKTDMADGRKYGVSWTPSIYVNGVKLRSGEADEIRAAITAALSK